MADKKPEKKGKNKTKKSDLYQISDGKLERKSASCPKCGAGIFMAKHKDRQTCGACGFTQWKKKEVTEKTE